MQDSALNETVHHKESILNSAYMPGCCGDSVFLHFVHRAVCLGNEVLKIFM